MKGVLLTLILHENRLTRVSTARFMLALVAIAHNSCTATRQGAHGSCKVVDYLDLNTWPGASCGRSHLGDTTMDHPILALIFVAVLGLALALGLFGDLRHALAQLRRGANSERRQARGGYETIRTNAKPDTHWRTGRPLHRNFGIPRKVGPHPRFDGVTYGESFGTAALRDLAELNALRTDLAYHSPLESQRSVPDSGILGPNLDRLA